MIKDISSCDIWETGRSCNLDSASDVMERAQDGGKPEQSDDNIAGRAAKSPTEISVRPCFVRVTYFTG